MNDQERPYNLIQIGYITRPHGIRGEVKVNYLLEEGLEKIRTLKRVYVCPKFNVYHLMDVQNIRLQSSNLILKFTESNTRNDAETFRGCQLFISKDKLPKRPEGKFYIDELIGLKAKNLKDESLGEVVDVLQLPHQEVYVIENKGIESLIPAVDEFIKKIDIRKNEIILDPIDGMINTNEN